MINYLPYIIGMGEFQKRGAALLKKLRKDIKEALLMSHNKPMAVLLSLERYNELRGIKEKKALKKKKRKKTKKRKTPKNKRKKKKIKRGKKKVKSKRNKTYSKKRMRKL